MAALLVPSSCCSSPRLLLHSRGSSSSTSLLTLLRSLCSSSPRSSSSRLSYYLAPGAQQHLLRAFQHPVPSPVSCTSVPRRRNFHEVGRRFHVEGQKRAVMTCRVASEALDSDVETLDSDVKADDAGQIQVVRRRDVGAFQQLPVVSPGSEILGTALRRTKMIKPTKGIQNAAKRERNRGAKQLDALTKELTIPLKGYVKNFPECRQLHPYEQSLLELTLGPGTYEETLGRVDLLRKRILDYGKNCASVCAKSTSKREAEERLEEGIAKLEDMFKKHGKAVDDLKEIAKVLRAMPVVHPRTPTVCLVGAPNVGKSSLVRILSSGKPEVCNYPFTTRGISMGHFFVDSVRYQVTDTPGLLKRPDEERNNIEKLTLAALAHLPTAVLYVHDLTGECGTSVPDQLSIYRHVKERFPERPWLDVVSKADLLEEPPVEIPAEEAESYMLAGPAGSLRVSVQTERGLDELVRKVHALLSEHSRTLCDQAGDNLRQKISSDKEPVGTFYSPAWPHVQG